MNCRSWVLTEKQLRDWLQVLDESEASVIAPIEEDGVLAFRRLASVDSAVVTPAGKTKWSPKEFLFPRSEALYRYRFSGDSVELEDPQVADQPQILFGVRSCDAAGIARLDEIFLSGKKDRLYAERRKQTTVISAACAGADPECFCTAVGVSPVGEEGADLQLVPLGKKWLLRTVTERGEALVGGGADEWKRASAEDTKKIKGIEKKVAKQIERGPLQTEWSEVLEGGFDHPAWERLAEHCLGCSVCAYVCPSCSCFDMNHEGNAWCGEQCRSWDACTFEFFTRHASGHNPRSTTQERYRQRVLHKFAFRDEDEDPFRCVGCGRCVALCPAGLDIGDTVAAAVAAIREGDGDAAR